jgi:hypothetical protein
MIAMSGPTVAQSHFAYDVLRSWTGPSVSVWQTGELRIVEQLPPTLDVERGLVFGAVQLDRQRHYESVFWGHSRGKLA